MKTAPLVFIESNIDKHWMIRVWISIKKKKPILIKYPLVQRNIVETNTQFF